MAIEAEIFALGRGKTDAIAGFPGRPMTAQALTLNRGTVPPWALLDHIAVALDAGCAADHAGYADGFATIEFMTIDTGRRQFLVTMKEVQPLHNKRRVDVGADALIGQFDALFFRNDGKFVPARLEGQPVMQNMPLFAFHDHNRFDDLTGCFQAEA